MLPYMPDKTNKKSKQISAFGGINQNKVINDNELKTSVNMSSQNYPVLSVSKNFETLIQTDTQINGAINYNGLFYTAFDNRQNSLYAYLNNNTALVCENATQGNRYYAGMSDNILIMPDKALYNVSTNSVKPLTHSQTFDRDSAIQHACEEMPSISSTVPQHVATITTGKISSNILTYGVYASFMMCPQKLDTGDFVFVKMSITTNDSAKDSECRDLISTLEKGLFIKITNITELNHFTLNGDKKDIFSFDFEGAINMPSDCEKLYVQYITIEKRFPDLSHICTYGNRIWGVENNSIRCSLLGDGTVWEDYSSDQFGTLPSSCFSLEVDTGGEFTAICEYNGNILAFKENCVHKIYGTQPENFTLSTQSIKGVQKGAHNTLVNINGILYYKGVDGFYKYSGGVPQCISDKLDNNFEAVSSCSDGNTYYTVVQKNGKKEILTYDTGLGIWHSLNEGDVFMLLYSDNCVTAISPDVIKKLDCNNCDNTKWEFILEFNENTFCQKRYHRILLDYSLGKQGYFTVTAMYDDNRVLNYTSGDYTVSQDGETIISLPFVKCRKIRLLFKGKGDFCLKKLTREFTLLKEGGK